MSTDARFWNSAAARYAKSPIRDMDAYRETLARTRSYLRVGDSVLEMGCGTGSTAIELAGNVRQILATDLSEEMLRVGRQRADAAGVTNIQFHCCAADQMPEGAFDVILAHNILHLLEDVEAVLAAVATRLHSGGLFISKTPCLGDHPSLLKRGVFKTAIPLMRLVGRAPGHVSFLHVQALEQAIQAAGFELVECGSYPVEVPSRYLVARRL